MDFVILRSRLRRSIRVISEIMVIGPLQADIFTQLGMKLACVAALMKRGGDRERKLLQ